MKSRKKKNAAGHRQVNDKRAMKKGFAAAQNLFRLKYDKARI
jgi:hypothetical protein